MESTQAQSSVPGPPAQPPSSFFMPPAPAPLLKPISPWVWIGAASILVFLAVLGVRVVANMRHQTAVISGVVATLHASMTKGDDVAIFNNADPAYQQQVGLQKSAHLFDYVRNSLGAPRSPHLIGTYISADSKTGQVLTLEYQTSFDKGAGTETIKFHKVDGRYLLLAYTVQSTKMNQSQIPADLKSD